MNIEKYIICVYGILAFLYGGHFVKKKYYDFIIFGIFYLCMSILYYKLDKSKKNDDVVLLSTLYFLCFLIYAKHQIYHRDIDYLFLSVPTIGISIVKYNILSKKGIQKLSKLEWINFLSMFGIGLAFGKHSFYHSSLDYVILFILYFIHTMSELKIYKLKN